jgi:hypothetical protein
MSPVEPATLGAEEPSRLPEHAATGITHAAHAAINTNRLIDTLTCSRSWFWLLLDRTALS